MKDQSCTQSKLHTCNYVSLAVYCQRGYAVMNCSLSFLLTSLVPLASLLSTMQTAPGQKFDHSYLSHKKCLHPYGSPEKITVYCILNWEAILKFSTSFS